MDGLETTLLLLIGVLLGYLAARFQLQLIRAWRQLNYRPRVLHRFEVRSPKAQADNSPNDKPL